MLLGVMNPCLCGFYGDAKKECRCSTAPSGRCRSGYSQTSYTAIITMHRCTAPVSAGGWHTCGVGTDGAVVCWGWDEFGEATPLGLRSM